MTHEKGSPVAGPGVQIRAKPDEQSNHWAIAVVRRQVQRGVSAISVRDVVTGSDECLHASS
jgi:hypothetical protein